MLIVPIDPEQHRQSLRALFWEYLCWANDRNAEHLGIRLDVQALLDADMADIEKYTLPRGQLLVADDNTQLAGCICLKLIREDVGELKRLYVRPAYRRQGLGTALIAAAIEQAEHMGIHTLWLDSARYMTDAQALYRRAGFNDIDPYPESEIPAEHHHYWVFMELSLA